MVLRYFHVSAFGWKPFTGNPAGVIPLEKWLPARVMQAIAAQNNLAETAFLVPRKPGVHALRWFTPKVEVDLCGHATLAAAHVLRKHFEKGTEHLTFLTRGGILHVFAKGSRLYLDFPAMEVRKVDPPPALIRGLGVVPRAVFKGRDYLAVYGRPEDVARLKPDMDALASVESLGVIVTAPGKGVDFVSRFFAPQAGIPEDPATGSAHAMLTPFWSQTLGKKVLRAEQLSSRGGRFWCRALGDRVHIGGHVHDYLEGSVTV
jgi:predicted PhzF superfamily epimerase YddE/YHI9